MKTNRLLMAFGGVLLAASTVAAQGQPGNIAALEYQTPKNGMTAQYEAGRKQKADWHRQQKDSQALYVFETMSGDHLGTYIVGRLGQHWADFDKPTVPDAADLEEYNKAVGPYVEKVVSRYWEFMPKDSNMPASGGPSKYTEVIWYHLNSGKEADFRSAVNRTTEAAQKTKWGVNYGWYELANGGRGGTFVLIVPHANWADFEDNPNVKPFREMLKDALGQSEADSVIKRFDDSIESTYSEIVQFRPDLSYVPAK